MDPIKKSKSPLCDNTTVAAALSTLTNFPYDAQHLPIHFLHFFAWRMLDTLMSFTTLSLRKRVNGARNMRFTVSVTLAFT